MHLLKFIYNVRKGSMIKNLSHPSKRRCQFSFPFCQFFSIPLIFNRNGELHHGAGAHSRVHNRPQNSHLKSDSTLCHDFAGQPLKKTVVLPSIYSDELLDSRPKGGLLSFESSLYRRSIYLVGSVEWAVGFRNIAIHRQSNEEASDGDDDRSRSLGDKLVLRGLVFHGYHGVYDEEKKLGQKFLVDVDVWLDLRKAGETDQLEQSISYAEIYRMIKSTLEGPPHNLLESVATAIVSDIFKKFPSVGHVRVKVAKPHVAVEGVVDYLGVEIFRSRSKDL